VHNPQSKVACSPILPRKCVRANDLQSNRLKTNQPSIISEFKNLWRHCMLLCRCRWIRVRENFLLNMAGFYNLWRHCVVWGRNLWIRARERTSNMADFGEFMTLSFYDVEIFLSRARQKTSNMADVWNFIMSLCWS